MNDFIVWLVVSKSNEEIESPLSYLGLFNSKEQAEIHRSMYLSQSFHFIDVMIVPVWRSSVHLFLDEVKEREGKR